MLFLNPRLQILVTSVYDAPRAFAHQIRSEPARSSISDYCIATITRTSMQSKTYSRREKEGDKKYLSGRGEIARSSHV